MKGRFWPRNKVELQGKIPINRNKSVEILLDYEEEERLNENDNCIQVNYLRWETFIPLIIQTYVKDKSYSLTDCILRSIAQKVGCSLNWFRTIPSVPTCTNFSKVRETQKYFEEIQGSPFESYVKKLGCRMPCSNQIYKVVDVIETPIVWSTPWLSEVDI